MSVSDFDPGFFTADSIPQSAKNGMKRKKRKTLRSRMRRIRDDLKARASKLPMCAAEPSVKQI